VIAVRFAIDLLEGAKIFRRDHQVHAVEEGGVAVERAQVFGEENFIASVIWQKVFSPKNSALYFSEDHDYVIIYARNKEIWRPELLPRSDSAESRYENSDDDPRGVWTSGDLLARNFYGKGTYEVIGPSGKTFSNPKGSYWRVSKENFDELNADSRTEAVAKAAQLGLVML